MSLALPTVTEAYLLFMSDLRESTARTRELGSELRRVRENARYSGKELATKLGWSQSKVSRMETGSRTISEVDAATYLAYCGVAGDELNRILELTSACHDEYWLQARGQRLADELHSLIVQETTAQVITYYEPMVIPGLLQTEDYARALFHECDLLPAEAIEPLVRTRMERQRLLRRQYPPKVTFYVHENALRMQVGDTRTMQEQLLHMLLVCAATECRLRVISTSVGARTSMIGQFTWMAHSEHNPVIYVEHLTTSLFLECRDDMVAYRRQLDRLNVLALDEGQSREVIASVASEYDQEEGGV